MSGHCSQEMVQTHDINLAHFSGTEFQIQFVQHWTRDKPALKFIEGLNNFYGMHNKMREVCAGGSLMCSDMWLGVGTSSAVVSPSQLPSSDICSL